jgi:hypothetical protein
MFGVPLARSAVSGRAADRGLFGGEDQAGMAAPAITPSGDRSRYLPTLRLMILTFPFAQLQTNR